VQKAFSEGVELAIVWNKSHSEHTIVGTSQSAVLKEARQAVQELNWKGQYFVDADHIGFGNLDLFIESSDFFTLDVADFISKKSEDTNLKSFVNKYRTFAGELAIPGIDQPLLISEEQLQTIAKNTSMPFRKQGRYTDILQSKRGVGTEEDLCVIKYALEHFGLPQSLKLSVHPGSDKFSIYRPIKELIDKHGAGIHVKTAGTTWLEELIGLAEAGEEHINE